MSPEIREIVESLKQQSHMYDASGLDAIEEIGIAGSATPDEL